VPACLTPNRTAGRLHLPILGSRNPVKRGFGGFMWGEAPHETPMLPPLVGENHLDAIALIRPQGDGI
jgi:hypothetical protein